MKRANSTQQTDTTSRSSHSRRSTTFSKATVSDATRLIVSILYWLIVCAALWFAYLNINPYAQAVKYVMDGTLDRGFFQMLLQTPFVGAVLRFFAVGGHWIIGLILWAVIQTIECFPIVLKHDRAFMRTVIDENEDSRHYDISEQDDPAVQWLKRWYNRFPMLTITKARNLALFAYTADFLICMFVYPPADGGFSNFFFLVMTGQFSALNWGNVALMMITLYAFEAIVHTLFFLAHITWYYRLSRTV